MPTFVSIQNQKALQGYMYFPTVIYNRQEIYLFVPSLNVGFARFMLTLGLSFFFYFRMSWELRTKWLSGDNCNFRSH